MTRLTKVAAAAKAAETAAIEKIATLVKTGSRTVAVRRLHQGRAGNATDSIAEEVPIALEYNGISHAVMLATPLDLDDFALGFSLAEGMIAHPDEYYGMQIERSALGITLHLEIASAAFARLKDRRRTLAGRTGCGLCGTESLAKVARELPPLGDGPRFDAVAINRAMADLHAHQLLHQATGAVHAAAWCEGDGTLRHLREDVGRHNALDKLIGALAAQHVDAPQGFIAITSRASFEMVQKSVAAGVTLLAAISAPTTLAVDSARAARLTLAGFVRDDKFTLYTDEAARLQFIEPEDHPNAS
ncbi:MAG: formate dehydrogenase accessory sulfurtransferase FdhD [Burkholderiaceae bacterium]|jgi:FdhD protein|nr:formate dehydrogenase accessory sulfurtransferase FdhD [Burkholderiaceae bacterium]